MAVSLCDCVTVTTAMRDAFFVSREDMTVGFGMLLFEPRKKCWTKVETDARVVVYGSVRRIALIVDPFVPIVIRRC
jgi:hypothetical protein